MKFAIRICGGIARVLALILLVMAGSVILVRWAPGYLSDPREMDSRYAQAARNELAQEAARTGSPGQAVVTNIKNWSHGDLGRSRQFDIPVLELIAPRLAVTGSLIGRAIGLAWLIALCAAGLSSALRLPSLLFQIPTTLLLAIPASALATVCLLTETGGPVLVLTLLIAARDFKFVDRIVRNAWREPHLLHARALGITTWSLIRHHLVPNVTPELLALSMLSVAMALSALVPVEVQFAVPGIGQSAWNAALNRDMPVLLAVSMIMAVVFTVSGLLSDGASDLTTP